MAIETPVIFTGVHEEEILQNNELQSLTEEVYRKIGYNNNWLIDLKPIGSIIFTDINQVGSTVPSTDVWQECNGSEIVNPNSPLRSIGVNQNFTPDLRDRYLRISDDLSTNPQGGSQEHNLQHTHNTGGPSHIGGSMDEKGDRNIRVPHNHAVAVQYSNPTVLTSPAFYKCIAYIKII